MKLSALYKDGDKEKGVVVTGAKAVLDETRAQAAKINGTKQTFPAVAEALMARIRHSLPNQKYGSSGRARFALGSGLSGRWGVLARMLGLVRMDIQGTSRARRQGKYSGCTMKHYWMR